MLRLYVYITMLLCASCTFAQKKEFHYEKDMEWAKWAFPEGTTETEEGIHERAYKTLKGLQKLFADETIIVVTHGQFARNLIAAHFECNYHEVATLLNAEIRKINI